MLSYQRGPYSFRRSLVLFSRYVGIGAQPVAAKFVHILWPGAHERETRIFVWLDILLFVWLDILLQKRDFRNKTSSGGRILFAESRDNDKSCTIASILTSTSESYLGGG